MHKKQLRVDINLKNYRMLLLERTEGWAIH